MSRFFDFFFQRGPKTVFKLCRRTVIKRVVLQSRTQVNLFLIANVAGPALFKVLFNLCHVRFVQLAINVGMGHTQCFLTIQNQHLRVI